MTSTDLSTAKADSVDPLKRNGRGKSKSKSKPRRRILSPTEIATASARLFNPFIRPARLIREPCPPSLAGSKLPPPVAEIDERPTVRIRRFRLWREAAPPLRLAVLDQRKRIHLRRYQSFAIPATPTPERRKFLPLPLPRPTRPGSPILVPDPRVEVLASSAEAGQAPVAGSEMVHPSIPDKGGGRTAQMDGQEQPSNPETGQPALELKAQVIPFPSPPPSPISGSHDSVDPQKRMSTQASSAASSAAEVPALIQPKPPILPTPPPSPHTLPRNLPPLTRAQRKAQKVEKELAHQRLLGHKWVLDQEHERRFRRGMETLMKQIMEFQEANTYPFERWKPGHRWKEGVDRAYVADILILFKEIHNKSDNIYDFLDPQDIAPVPDRQRTHRRVKYEEEKRRRKAEKREKKRAERAATVDATAAGHHDLRSGQAASIVSSRSDVKVATSNKALRATSSHRQTFPNAGSLTGANDSEDSASDTTASKAPVTPHASAHSADSSVILSLADDDQHGDRDGSKKLELRRSWVDAIDATVEPEANIKSFSVVQEPIQSQAEQSGLHHLMRQLQLACRGGGGLDTRLRSQEELFDRVRCISESHNAETASSLSASTSGFSREGETSGRFSDNVTIRFGSLNMDDDTLKPGMPSSHTTPTVDVDTEGRYLEPAFSLFSRADRIGAGLSRVSEEDFTVGSRDYEMSEPDTQITAQTARRMTLV